MLHVKQDPIMASSIDVSKQAHGYSRTVSGSLYST